MESNIAWFSTKLVRRVSSVSNGRGVAVGLPLAGPAVSGLTLFGG